MTSRPAAVQLGPTELRRFRAKHKLRQEDLAQLLGISRLAIARWETSTRSVPPYMNLTLEGLTAHLPAPRRARALTQVSAPHEDGGAQSEDGKRDHEPPADDGED